MDLRKLLLILGQGFGTGLSPNAPGTVGSFAAAVIFYYFIWDSIDNYLGIALFFLFVVVCFFIGIFVLSQIIDEDKDPKSFVWDEFVGMWTSCVPLLFIDKDITKPNSTLFRKEASTQTPSLIKAFKCSGIKYINC